MNKRSAFSNEVDYGLAIGRRVGRIGDIRDLLARTLRSRHREAGRSGSSTSGVAALAPMRIG